MHPSILIVGNLLSGSTGTRAPSEDLAERLSAAGHSVRSTSRRLARLPRLLDIVTTVWARRKHYDVAIVDVFSGPAFFIAECACAVLRQAKKPYVLVLHGGNLPAFASRYPERVRRLFRPAAAIVAPSHYLIDGMKSYCPSVSLIPNALDILRYEFQLREPAAPHLIWLRAFHDIYNPTLAVEVMHRLIPDFPQARLTMIGPDKHDGSLEATKQRVTALRLAHCVSLKEAVPKVLVPSILRSGDIFLNTSRIDNTPVSVVEAMAMGLCVVSTDVGGMTHLIDGNHNGILTPSGNADAMVAAVRRVLTEPELAPRLSKNARTKAEKFDWSAILPQWTAVLKSVHRGGSNMTSVVQFDARSSV